MTNTLIAEDLGNQDTTPVFNFATIGQVYADGVSLIFDGQEEPTEKHYKCNTSIIFSAGDRVKILSDSGTYVVEYVVGAPSSGGGGGGEDIDATTLNGKTESELSVANAAKLNNKTESELSVSNSKQLNGKDEDELSVADAEYVTKIRNMFYAETSSSSETYALQFRTSSSFGGGNIQVRIGNYGTWKTLSTQ